jgi:hypothetical protein
MGIELAQMCKRRASTDDKTYPFIEHCLLHIPIRYGIPVYNASCGELGRDYMHMHASTATSTTSTLNQARIGVDQYDVR